MLVLGLMDRAVPLSSLLGGAMPGIRLGLANTVLLFAVFRMTPRDCVLLMLVKILLSGFLHGSVSAMIYSFSGGALSLAAMLAGRKHPASGSLTAALAAMAAAGALLSRNPSPGGMLFACAVIAALGAAGGLAVFLLLRRNPGLRVVAVSLFGALAHNLGQVLAAALISETPLLLTVYLPVLIAIGGVMGCMTGIVARMVFRALKEKPAG